MYMTNPAAPVAAPEPREDALARLYAGEALTQDEAEGRFDVRAALDAGAAGAICGSAIVDLAGGGEPVRPFVEAMKSATRSLCTAGTH